MELSTKRVVAALVAVAAVVLAARADVWRRLAALVPGRSSSDGEDEFFESSGVVRAGPPVDAPPDSGP